MLILRDYQVECVNNILKEYEKGNKSQLVILPTGSGKTVIFAELCRRMDCKALVLAHREELLSQTMDKMEMVWPGCKTGIVKAEREEYGAQIIVGSVQSCCRDRRLERLKGLGIKLLIVDEAHHVMSESYRKILIELGFDKEAGICGEKLLIGVTATPSRGDKQGLGSVFEKIACERSIGTMIRGGYLAEVEGRELATGTNLGGIKSSMGDFAIGELAERVNTEERNEFIVEKYKEYAEGKKGVAFCCDVAHCQDLALEMREKGIEASAVWGDMEDEERKRELKRFNVGELKILTSCGILTEGWDEPSIECVLMCRPTKSVGLYVQCVGRGLRRWPGKEKCLVLDFTDTGHKLDTVVDLSTAVPEALIHKETGLEDDKNKEEGDGSHESKINPRTKEIDEIKEMLDRSRFVWVEVKGNYILQGDSRDEIEISRQEAGWVASYWKGQERLQLVEKPIDLGYCQGICEDWARRHMIIYYSKKSNLSKMCGEATPKQRELLEKKGRWQEGMSKSEASFAIREMSAEWGIRNREPLTDKQRYFLSKRGIETKGMSKGEASRMIGSFKNQ